jgi:ribonuclease VapC
VVIDTSAVIAILQGEPAADRLIAAVENSGARRISAASLVEAGIVLQARYGDHGELELDLLVQRARIDVIPVTEDHAGIARSGFRRFGKGRHPAGLNYGDCFSYALAIALGEPLLFVGTDFSRTDATAAVY